MTHENLSHLSHSPSAREQEQCIYKTFPLIRKIAYKKLKNIRTDFVEDILQTVAMRLWKWRNNGGGGRDLTDDEWCRLANKVTHNEIRRFCRKEISESIRLSILNGNEHHPDLEDYPLYANIEGNTDLEVRSILLIVWKNLSVYSVLEKYAYLLQSDDLSRLLLTHKCCKMSELAECLGLTTEEFLGLIRILPLSDKDIVGFMGQKLSLELTPKQILDARYRVRLRLHRALANIEAGIGAEPGTQKQIDTSVKTFKVKNGRRSETSIRRKAATALEREPEG